MFLRNRCLSYSELRSSQRLDDLNFFIREVIILGRREAGSI